MRHLCIVTALCLCFVFTANAAEEYAISPTMPGNTVTYPKKLRRLRESLPALREKAVVGDAEAQCELGEKLLMLEEKEEARQWLKKSAEHDNPAALYLLGYAALEEQKTDEAAKWLEKSAAKGNTQALVMLGDLFQRHRRDPARSFPYYKRGAEAGNAHAQYRLAVSYSQGFGVRKDVKKGLELLKLSASNGLPEPMFMLFEIYSDPQPAKLCGEKVNPAKAAYWIERAAASRTGSALPVLFDIYEKGKGPIKPDAVRGWLWAKWVLDAIDNHDSEDIFYGKKSIEKIINAFYGKMTDAERESAARTFKEWLDYGYPVLSVTEPE